MLELPGERAAPAQVLRLPVRTLPQPDETTCGPTCLHAVYRYWGDQEPLAATIERTWRLQQGGTFAVFLGCDALRKGYHARIYTYNLTMFDPTWFTGPRVDIAKKLELQRAFKTEDRVQYATAGYLEFLRLGGKLRLASLSQDLIRRLLTCGLPILTGLSSTYLYRSAREGPGDVPDDLLGLPVGHFVVIAGWEEQRRRVLVADPYQPNPWGPAHEYWVRVDRVMAATLLGIVTHDANLLVVYPRPHAGVAAA